MYVLAACEESQAVTIEARKLGHDAYSCDILPCSGLHPEWHLLCDVEEIINQPWDIIIAFPPCTYLSNVGRRYWNEPGRPELREKAKQFFMMFINADCPKIAVENPVGCMNSEYRKPDQIIHPYYFGDPYMKRTCLWLKGLPLLKKTQELEKPAPIYERNGHKIHWCEAMSGCRKDQRSMLRSRTFPGIARAMANQWLGVAQ